MKIRARICSPSFQNTLEADEESEPLDASAAFADDAPESVEEAAAAFEPCAEPESAEEAAAAFEPHAEPEPAAADGDRGLVPDNAASSDDPGSAGTVVDDGAPDTGADAPGDERMD